MAKPVIAGKLGFYFDGGVGNRWIHNGDDWEPALAPVSVDSLVDGKTLGESVFVGTNAGGAATVSTLVSVAVGDSALSKLTGGQYNVAIGAGAGRNVVTATSIVALGDSAMANANINQGDVAIGDSALRNVKSSRYNIAIGSTAMYHTTSGSSNIALGYGAGANFGDTDLGFPSGISTVSNKSIYIGENCGPRRSNEIDQIVIGHRGTGMGSNTATFGTKTTASVHLMGVSINAPRSTTAAIVAANGKVMITKEYADSVYIKAAVINNLTTGGTTDVLSAEMGKSIGARIASDRVFIGADAGTTGQAAHAIAIGGAGTDQGEYAINIGASSTNDQGDYSIALGNGLFNSAPSLAYEVMVGNKDHGNIHFKPDASHPAWFVQVDSSAEQEIVIQRTGTTGARPAAPTLGQFYFDTTVNKPTWWNATNWTDAAGLIIS